MEDLLTKDDDATILDEAKTRFKYAMAWESAARANWLYDYKYAEADSLNFFQWDRDSRASRDANSNPYLTLNKIAQHNRIIINDGKQNKPSIRFRPVSDEASVDAAKVLEGIARHIEYQSKAQVAYDTASEFQVKAGLGALRIETDYVDENTFDQEIYIRRVKDPLTILWDPDVQEADYSDQRFCFVFEDLAQDEFKIKYPEFGDSMPQSPFGVMSDTVWYGTNKVRIAEYWRRLEVKDELLMYTVPETASTQYALKSALPNKLYNEVAAASTSKKRSVIRSVVQHFIIVGDTVARREPWAGKYIPIIPVIGEETVINGTLDRKGHTRAMLDPQRLLNYWYSAATAQVAFQTTSPWIGAAAAFEGLETYWSDANTTTNAFIPYNHVDDDGQPIPPPQRTPLQTTAPAFLEGMTVASQEIMAVSGQYQAQLGQQSNERSGKAIAERQRQGDNATAHFINGLAIAVRQCGRVILDLIPKIYDQKRVMRILGEDNSERQVIIDPGAEQAYSKEEEQQGEMVREIFNPAVGKYDVQADIGPSYGTARQEAWNAFVQIAVASPEIMQIAGDLMFKAADFPMADDIAERFANIIPAAVSGKAPPVEIQQMIEQGKAAIQTLMQRNQDLEAQLKGAAAALTQKDMQLTARDQEHLVDVYKAETDRLKAMMPDKSVLPQGAIDPQMLAQLAAQLVLDTFKLPIGDVAQAAVQDLASDAGSFGVPRQPEGMAQAMAQPQHPMGGAMPMHPGMPQPHPAANNGPPPQQGPGAQGLPPGAQLAPDGSHYLPDPNRPGKWLQITGS